MNNEMLQSKPKPLQNVALKEALLISSETNGEVCNMNQLTTSQMLQSDSKQFRKPPVALPFKL